MCRDDRMVSRISTCPVILAPVGVDKRRSATMVGRIGEVASRRAGYVHTQLIDFCYYRAREIGTDERQR